MNLSCCDDDKLHSGSVHAHAMYHCITVCAAGAVAERNAVVTSYGS